MGSYETRLLLGEGRPSLPEIAPPHTPGQSSLLQALRGLAALSIAFLHITQQAGAFAGRPGEAPYPWLRPLPWDAGVLVFFVISGVVMVWSSSRLFGKPGAARRFIARRLARVVPLYWAATLILMATLYAAPTSVNQTAPSPGLVAASFLFLPWRRGDGLVQPLLGLGWTLNYEMLFYAIFAACIVLPRRLAIAGVLATMAGLAALGWALQPANAALAFWTDPIVLEFAAGVGLAVLARRLWLPSRLRLGLALAGLAGLLAAGGWTAVPEPVVGVSCAAIVAAAVLGPIRPARSPPMRALVRLGDASYALYLFHPFAMRALALVWRRAGLASVPAVLCYIVLAMATAVALALAIHLWLERPLTVWTRRLLDAPEPATT